MILEEERRVSVLARHINDLKKQWVESQIMLNEIETENLSFIGIVLSIDFLYIF